MTDDEVVDLAREILKETVPAPDEAELARWIVAQSERRCATCANFREPQWSLLAECIAIHRDSDAASTVGPRLTVAPTFGCVLWTPRQ